MLWTVGHAARVQRPRTYCSGTFLQALRSCKFQLQVVRSERYCSIEIAYLRHLAQLLAAAVAHTWTRGLRQRQYPLVQQVMSILGLWNTWKFALLPYLRIANL